MVDRSAEVDHAVDGVDAHRRQSAGRRLVAARAPGVRLEEQRVGERHRRLDVQDRSQLARPDPLRATSSSPGGSGGCSRARASRPLLRVASTEVSASTLVSANGFSQKTCLPARGGGDDLLRVQRVRRRKNDRVDLRIVRSGPRTTSASRRPCSAANVRASGDDVREVPATKRIASLPTADSTSVLPHQPSPTIAAWIISWCGSESTPAQRRGHWPWARRAPRARCSLPARARRSCRRHAVAACPHGPCRSPR